MHAVFVCQLQFMMDRDEIVHVFRNNTKDAWALDAISKLTKPASDIKTAFPIGGKILAENVSLLHLAAYNGWSDVFDKLATEMVEKYEIAHEPCFDSEGRNSLHYAASNGQLEMVKVLKEKFKYNILRESNNGSSTLHFSSLFGHLNIIQYLREMGFPGYEPTNSEGHTPLHLACKNGHLNVAEFLITELNCRKTCRDIRYDATPLHLASRHGHLNIVRYLIEKQGCDPMDTTNDHETPLHLACINGHADVIEYLLLIVKVDCDVRNKFAITPEEYAHSREDILILFQNRPSVPEATLRAQISQDESGMPFLSRCPSQEASIIEVDKSNSHLELQVTKAVNLLDKCEFERTRARELGLKLEIAHADLKNITKADGFCLIDEVINTWYKSSVEGPTWEKLITAVDECGDKRAAESLRELVMHQGEKELRKGLQLEANDRQFPYYVCVATILDRERDKVLIHFDGWSNDYDYTCSVDSVELHPVGWCRKNGWRLDKPTSWTNTKAEWDDYIKKGADASYFKADQLAGKHSLKFSAGMIVEVTDKNLEVARIARITDIKSNHLRIHFEGWPDDDDIWCLPDCPDIHPPSWHKQNQQKLEPPRGHVGKFQWANFLKTYPFLVPAPAYIFTEEQYACNSQ